MNTLIFHNPGEIDIRGACIAGLSAKEGDSPIGYFGTGLKYAIACILRWGGEITIYSGETAYHFYARELEFRGEQFKQIVMQTEAEDERELGFTTEYGKNWQPWQVFRELYANARDENGFVQLDTHHSMIGEGWTHIFVKGVPALVESYYERDKIILPSTQIFDDESDKVQFCSAPAFGIYYRGVRVFDQASYFTWNFLASIRLTEDRTLSSVMSVSYYFDKFIVESLHNIEHIMQLFRLKYEDKEFKISRIVERDGKPHSFSERPVEGLFMDWFTPPDTACGWHTYEYKEACKRLYQRDPTTYRALRSYVKSLDESLVAEKLHTMTPREQQMFDKAIELVALFGFAEEVAKVPIHIQDLGGNTLGLYEHGTIYLSSKLFDQGTKQLVATLYEECYHHRTQNKDCTYNMQSDLFNIIISLNEEIHKVIC